jgi:hypothetical protein
MQLTLLLLKYRASHQLQLNEMMDSHVNARVDHIFPQCTLPPPMTIKFEGWSYWIDDTEFTTDLMEPLLQKIHEDTMCKWLSHPEHLRMTTASFF